jgi:UDPglucose 6-dehydrogenase
VFGLGFVGLTTALCLAEKGYRLKGFDCDPAKAGRLAKGEIPFHEPGLGEALVRHVRDGRFSLAESFAEAAAGAEYAFLCVGTPAAPSGRADLSHLLAAAEMLAEAITPASQPTVFVKSTVPPGSTAGPVREALESGGLRLGQDFHLAATPEFLREGKAWEDANQPDRIVAGLADPGAEEPVRRLFGRFAAPLRLLTATEAEFVKYLSNSLLATLISFANEQALLARAIGGLDVAKTFRVLPEEHRWSGRPAGMTSYVFPGCGFGGYCLPKDVKALLALARDFGLEGDMLAAALRVNEQAKIDAARRISRAAGDPSKRIAVLGLSFKPGSDDVRDSPAAGVIGELLSLGYSRISAHDPEAMDNYAAAYGHRIEYGRDAAAIVDTADVVALLTAWPEYGELDLAGKNVVDCRYFFKIEHSPASAGPS